MPATIDRRSRTFAGTIACAAALLVSPAAAFHEFIEAQISFLQEYAPNVEFPAVGALYVYSDSDGLQWICGGTLIAPRWFLTVGHCVAGAGVATDMMVFLQAEGIIPVHAIHDICQAEEVPEICAANEDIVALVELSEPAAVWPWMVRGRAELPNDLALVGYGMTAPPEQVGQGAKARRAVAILKCEDSSTEVCQESGRLPCYGYSGSPLLAENVGALDWAQVAVTRTGGGSCKFGIARYPDVSFEEFSEWIDNTIATTAPALRREIRGWGRVQFGRFGSGGSPGITPRDTVFSVPKNPHGAPWPEPTEVMKHSNAVEVVAVPKVDLLRFTMNHEAYSYRSQCEEFNRPCQNHFALSIHGPAPDSAERSCECSSGRVFVQCDCKEPDVGTWTFDVEHVHGAGHYQLLVLPLGPLQPVSGDAPAMAQRHGERTAVPRMIARSARLGSAPIIRVNVDEDGNPAGLLGRIIRRDVREEMHFLRERLRASESLQQGAGPEPGE